MKLLIIRHAEPYYPTDSLTEKGFREAELLSRRLGRLRDVEAVYVSPLGRAQRTAEPTLARLGMTAETLPWLAEFRGQITDPETGKKRIPWDLRPRIYGAHPALHRFEDWTSDPLIAGGNSPEIWRETTEGLDALLARHGYVHDGPVWRCGNNRTGSILLFCHFGVGAAMLGWLTGISPSALWQGFCMQPSAVTTLITEERTKGEVVFRCMSMGDLSHLNAADEPYSTAALYPEVYNGRDTTAPPDWDAWS